MAVSKRTRFEVLRRDNHTCRYCGEAAPDVKLTVDHVLPVTLGGSDDPSNLVAACRDCNAGKSSTSPDAATVAQVADDAVRWARAMAEAGRREHERRAGRDATLTHFKDHVWNAWVNYRDEPEQLPADWEYAIVRQLDSGLTMADLTEAVQSTMTKTYVRTDHFRYFMGVCKTMLAERMDRARAIIAEEDES